MGAEEVLFPQDINLQLTIKVEAGPDNVANITVPVELRITEKVFLLIHQLLEAQGLRLGNMNITPLHVAEVRDLPNVQLQSGEE
jgi:hypothetical protein